MRLETTHLELWYRLNVDQALDLMAKTPAHVVRMEVLISLYPLVNVSLNLFLLFPSFIVYYFGEASLKSQ